MNGVSFSRRIVFIVLLALGSPLFAELVWEKTELSFRPGYDDEEVVGHFIFANKGSKPVTITGIETSCGCTTAQLEKKTYAAGELGKVTAVFTIGGRVGDQEKMVAVTTSDNEEPTTLTMFVKLPPAMAVHPLFIYWSAEEALEPKKLSVTVPEDFAATGLTVASSDEHVAAAVREVEKGRAYEIILTPKKSAQTVTAQLTIAAETAGKTVRKSIAYARLP